MTNWIWYPGDFELYHGAAQNFEREERGFFWPAYWKADGWALNLKFSRTYDLKNETTFKVYGRGSGYVALKWRHKPEEMKHPYDFYEEIKYPMELEIHCPAKEVTVEIAISSLEGIPAVFVEGEVIFSDASWMVSDLAHAPVQAGYSPLFTEKKQNPMEFPYTSQICRPSAVEEVNGGLLFDFGRELTAETCIEFLNGRKELTLCYGESRQEALDVDLCYLKQHLTVREGESRFGSFESQVCYRSKLRAFRYIFIPEGEHAAGVEIKADYKYVDFPQKSYFNCADERINEIWQVSETTFRLANGIFFLDGIKRDRWIWSGDAYQSYFINQYLFSDPEICKRTILALRGKDPVCQHLNTIVDYSLYWIISIENYYMMTGDIAFVRSIYEKAESMMRYCMAQTDEKGFIYGRPGDWVFIDWARFDQEGTLCAEQMLLARSYQAMAALQQVLEMDTKEFTERFEDLKANILAYYWDEEKGAFIDSFVSGKRNVTRHANIFAVLFDYVSSQRRTQILEQVLLNESIDAITTPYFKFYELEAFAQLGCMDKVIASIKSYWGGMLDRGADTFWEEYKPDEPEEEQYGMYGDKYGKSLCHAWGASPIYLIARYAMGLYPAAPGYQRFVVQPDLTGLTDFTCHLPVGDGVLKLKRKGNILETYTDKEGGVLRINRMEYRLEKKKTLKVVIL